jgi:hypothetical protein
MSSSAVVQTKLTVNEPDDQYEQEAERVADTVMRMPSPMEAPPPSSNTGPPPLGNPLYMSRERASKGSEESFGADEANYGSFMGSSLMRMPVPSYPSQSISTITQMSPVQAQLIARPHAARAEAVQFPPPVTPESRIAHQIKKISGSSLQTRLIQRTPNDVWDMNNVNVGRERAKEILKEDFYSNWFLAKDYLIENKWSDKEGIDIEEKKPMFEQLMRLFLDLRRAETDLLLEYIRDNELEEQEFQDLAPKERLSWSDSGSETLTSDIDVNLKGPGSIAAVTLFNQLFKTKLEWPYDPGTVYDVNVYAQDFMEKKPFNLEKDDEKNTATLIPQQEVVLKGEAFAKFAADQDMWSLVKMRIYMTPEEWQAYRTSIIGDSLKPYEEGSEPKKDEDENASWEKQQQRIQFEEAEGYYNEFQVLLQEKMLQINTSTDELYVTMRENLEAGQEYLSEHQTHDVKKMMAANLIYQEKLDEVAAIRLKLSDLSQEPETNQEEIKKYGLQLKNALSHTIIYANEAYLTQGAVHFVVIGQQIGQGIKKKKGLTEVNLELSNEEHLHSLREQVGDTLKVLAEYSEGPLWKAAYKAGKYIDRMAKSATPLIGDTEVQGFNELSTLGETAVKLKGEKADSSQQETGLNPVLDYGSVSDLRAKVIQFGVDVEKTYKENQTVNQDEVTTEPTTELEESDDNNPVGVNLEQGVEQAQDQFSDLVELFFQTWG